MHKLIIGQYKGLAIEPFQVFTEEDISIAIIELCSKLVSEWARNNMPAKKGDEVVVNIEAKCDDMVVPELLKSNFKYRVGDPELLEHFSQVIGRKKGDRFTMEIAFPENSPNERIRGKTVSFCVTVEDITHADWQLEINDEIARQIDPGVKGVDELKGKLRKIITANWLQMIRDNNIQAILDTIISGSEYEIDEKEFKEVYDKIMAESQKKMFSLPISAIMESIFPLEDDQYFNKKCEMLAGKTIIEELIINEIIRLEGIDIGDDELEEEMFRFSEFVGQETYSQLFPSEEHFRNYVLRQKTFDLLLEWNIKKTLV